MSGELGALFAPPAGGTGTLPVVGAVLTAWDPATYANTVSVGGATTYTNLPVLHPSLLALGDVVLLRTAGGPLVLGNPYQAA